MEARETRHRQDARLVNAQRQSQLIVTGFLAMTAIFVTAVSVVVAARPQSAGAPNGSGALVTAVAAVFAAVALVNSAVWISTHTAARHWREVAEFKVLVDFPGSTEALPRLRRHLVGTFVDHFNHNEIIVRQVQRRVGAQAALTLSFVYLVPLVAAIAWELL